MANLPGPDQLFRELRAPARNPEDHAAKTVLASEAWAEDSYKLPRKAHFLLEWALDRLLKTRSEESLFTPILDHRLWQLVLSLLRSEQAKRELKQTLVRIPVLPTLASLLARYPTVVERTNHEELLQAVYACYETMLPLCVSGSNIDALLGCVSSFLSSSAKIPSSETWLQFSRLLLGSVTSLPNDKNTQKKLSSLLLEQSFPEFLAGFQIAGNTDSLSELSSYLLFSSGNLQRIFSQPLTGVEAATKALHDLFSALNKAFKSGKTASLAVEYLPHLFSTYYIALQANASEIFAPRGATTSSRSAAETHIQQQLRHAVFGFLQGALSSLSNQEAEAQASCLEAMLAYLEEKQIYAAGPSDANQEWLRVLKETASLLVKSSGASSAVHALSKLARIDFAAVEDVLPALLADLAHRPAKENEVFVEIAIDYYGRTRQLPQFIVILEEAISSSLTSISNQDLDACFTGPLLSIATRSALTRECMSSLGATQVIPLAEVILESCKSPLEQALQASADEDSPRKKKRKMEKEKDGNDTQTLASYRLQATVQLLQAMLSARPVVAGDTSKLVHIANALIRKGLAGLQDVVLKTSSEQRSAACCLQLHVAFQNLEGCVLEDLSGGDLLIALESVQANEIRSNVQGGSPVLRLELLHWLLRRGSTESSMSTLLDILRREMDAGEGVWSGYTHRLDKASLAIAIWHLISQQYLPIFEKYANPTQISELAKFILEKASTETVHSARSGISLATVTQRLLSSADFYEMPRLRYAIVTLLASTSSSNLSKSLRVLAMFPDAYLDRPLKRKMVSDVQASGQQGELVNVLLLRLTKDDQAAPLLKDTAFLASLANGSDSSETAFELFEQLWRLSLRSCSGNAGKLDQFISFLDELRPIIPAETRRFSLYLSALAQIVEEIKVSHLSTSLKDKLSAYADSLLQTSVSMLEQPGSDLTICVSACNTAQLLNDWLGQPARQAYYAPIIRKSLTKMLSTSAQAFEPNCLAWLELACRNLSRDGFGFETVIVSLLLLLPHCDVSITKRFERIIVRASHHQDEESYTSALSVLEEALTGLSDERTLPTALGLTTLLICNPPDSCTRIATQAFSTLLRVMSGMNIPSLSALSIQAITIFLKRVCEQRISILELHDVSTIWTIFSSICQPSQQESGTTEEIASSIYLNMINTISFITTHRRDHLIPTFPHFCAVVTNLIYVLQISGLQTSKKRETIPFPNWAITNRPWIDSRHTKALTRLLVSLGTKSTTLQRSRKRDNSNDSQPTSVSLVGVLSKHAPFILVAFLRASTAATPLSSDVRKELTVGILELLSTMSKHEREALMKGFMGQSMEAERTLLRSLWKEYDRVRYKGD